MKRTQPAISSDVHMFRIRIAAGGKVARQEREYEVAPILLLQQTIFPLLQILQS